MWEDEAGACGRQGPREVPEPVVLLLWRREAALGLGVVACSRYRASRGPASYTWPDSAEQPQLDWCLEMEDPVPGHQDVPPS